MKRKFYVVWHGKTTGIFNNWAECKEQIDGFEGAKYKSFETMEEAIEAYRNRPEMYIRKKNIVPSIQNHQSNAEITKPLSESIAVDGAWNTKTGKIEYQGVYTRNSQMLFHQGPFEDGTNNIAEFLGIVHALAYCKERNLTMPIYSDSHTAITWIRNKKANTNHVRTSANQILFNILDRAENWLHANQYSNQILKWQTTIWGEIPADFGRK